MQCFLMAKSIILCLVFGLGGINVDGADELPSYFKNAFFRRIPLLKPIPSSNANWRLPKMRLLAKIELQANQILGLNLAIKNLVCVLFDPVPFETNIRSNMSYK